MKRYAILTMAMACLSAFLGTGSAAAAGCPNEAFRIGPSALLPNCRAYEMVSPVEKNGANISPGVIVKTDPSGNDVSFYSTGVFAGGQASPLASAYVARRAGGSWATSGVESPQLNGYGFFEYASPAISEDADQTFQASRLALAPGAIEGGSNLYIRDNLTGALRLVAALPGSALWEEAVGYAKNDYVDGTPDWSNVVLASSYKLTPNATEFGAAPGRNLYEFTDGNLRLADILPNGEPSPVGGAPVENTHTISTDGSRVMFLAAPNSQSGPLYIRLDGSRTIAASASQRAGNKGEVESVVPYYADADLSFVIFSTNQNMVEGNETKGSNTLYRYDVESGTLTDLITNKPAEGAKVGGLDAAGEDGTVFFHSDAVLAPGGEELTSNGDNLYAERHGKVEYIGKITEALGGTASASANGRYFAFATRDRLTATDLPSPACAEEKCLNVYRFDAETEQLSCVSCDGPAAGNSVLGNPEARSPSGAKRVRSVLDNGTVFFQSPNRLIPRDVNGVADVYAWNGAPELISSGTAREPSAFGNSTADGSNVFFLTSQSLVPQDTDGSIDVYDDRELGGLASQYPASATSPCENEVCRGASPSAPTRAAAGSASGSAPESAPQCVAVSGAATKAKAAAARAARRAKAAGAAAKKNGSARSRGRAKSLRKRAEVEGKHAAKHRKRASTCARRSS